MRASILAAQIWAATACIVQAQDSEPTLERAMARVAAYDWAAAIDVSNGLDAIEADAVKWHALRGGSGSFDDYRAFLARRPDWPGLPLLRQVGEGAIPADADPDLVIAYFTGQLPRTGTGSLRLAAALTARGAGAIAADEIRRAWLTMPLDAEEYAAFVETHFDTIRDLTQTRLDRMIWDGNLSQAEALFPLLGPSDLALAKARIALLRNEDGVDDLIAAVSDDLADDPGLAFARFKWRLARGRTDDAREMLLAQSRKTGGLGDASAWAKDRQNTARRAMQDGKAQLAYDLAQPHGLAGGSDFAALEWLSGYIALRYLDKPQLALDHFRRFRISVDTPISLSRAGYWEGRALEALGETEAAYHAFEFAAEYSTAFYGQLAAARIDLAPSAVLPLDRDVPALAETPLAQSTVLQAARAFHAAGEPALYRRFLRHLAEAGTPPEQAALGRMAMDMGEPYTALYIAKYAADHGNMLMRPYFPTIALPDNLPVDPALVMAVIRRESEFNAAAISRANARGLMQVMPATGRDMAAELGQSLDVDDLVDDPKLNVRLGAQYLMELTEAFDGYLPAMLAAYNAGPSRATAWRKIPGYGARDVDRVVDWVEAVPFAETRNYIMRVAEGYQVYRVTMGGDDDWVLPDLLTGHARVGSS